MPNAVSRLADNRRNVFDCSEQGRQQRARKHEAQDLNDTVVARDFARQMGFAHIDQRDIARPLQEGALADDELSAAAEIYDELKMIETASDMLGRPIIAQGARSAFQQQRAAEMQRRGHEPEILRFAKQRCVTNVDDQLAQPLESLLWRGESGRIKQKRLSVCAGRGFNAHFASRGRGGNGIERLRNDFPETWLSWKEHGFGR
ncbi:hypothetical protein [Rhizobium leucaenae]|uniref:Uncharacterized protein n=1 Tax=Rhizobium leucaenae TaxID=29450 RepID=A0A7W6ZY60_9HYPH|nr:hypothetical protein [Rhizobium leucaenae]MBB4570814.1 hypothetical protein [Rhizobium leucaenae]MBB6303644.1 hypothetical protein [Rhizobium leucaenae]